MVMAVNYRCIDAGGRRTVLFFFFNDPAPTEISTLSLPDALPISPAPPCVARRRARGYARAAPPTRSSAAPRGPARLSRRAARCPRKTRRPARSRAGTSGWGSEEHTSELQSRLHLVCRLLLQTQIT